MRFTEKYGITRSADDDWFDLYLPADTNLAIDPFLIWDDGTEFWGSAHSHLTSFFDMIFALIRDANGDEESASWKRAERLLIFPEPAEFCLGVADGSPLGSGSNRGLQQDMLQGIKSAVSVGMYNIAHMEAIAIFQGGIGQDRISDTVCNILKSYFIDYTEKVCAKYKIPTEKIMVQNSSWSEEYLRWKSDYRQLPTNKVFRFRKGKFHGKKIPILLTPERFLKDIPIADSDGHWNWAWKNMGEELRADFNFDIARRVGKSYKSRLARYFPESVALYLGELEGATKIPYPVAQDPKKIVALHEDGKEILRDLKDPVIPESKTDFHLFIKAVVDYYKASIENQDGWYLLWHKGFPREERASQVLFRSVASHYCKAADVDITGESNAGRGPVDFKFSRGWEARALVEVKLIHNSAFWDGVLAQLPRYQLAEGIDYGVFLAIAYTESDLEKAEQEKIERAASIAGSRHGLTIVPVIVDARVKPSASKVTDRQAKNELESSKTDAEANSGELND